MRTYEPLCSFKKLMIETYNAKSFYANTKELNIPLPLMTFKNSQ